MVRKQVEPSIEIPLINLRVELERLVAEEIHPQDISVVFGEPFIATGEWELAAAGFNAAVLYILWRDFTFRRCDPLDFVPQQDRRADFVAAALMRLATFCHEEEPSEAVVAARECVKKLEAQLNELLALLAKDDVNRWVTYPTDNPKLVERVQEGVKAVQVLAERLPDEWQRQRLKRLLGRHAVDEKSRKSVLELDRLDRMRQAVFATRAVLFDGIADDADIERLVPDGQDGDERARRARVRAQRARVQREKRNPKSARS